MRDILKKRNIDPLKAEKDTKFVKEIISIKKRQADKQEYQSMIIQINKDNEYLSTRKEISDIDFAKWNRGMYDYDKKNGDLVLKNGIVTGYNVCKRVKNVVNPSCIRATV